MNNRSSTHPLCKTLTLTPVGSSPAVVKLNLQLPSLLGHVGGASSGSTKVMVEPDGVNRLNDSIS